MARTIQNEIPSKPLEEAIASAFQARIDFLARLGGSFSWHGPLGSELARGGLWNQRLSDVQKNNEFHTGEKHGENDDQTKSSLFRAILVYPCVSLFERQYVIQTRCQIGIDRDVFA